MNAPAALAYLPGSRGPLCHLRDPIDGDPFTQEPVRLELLPSGVAQVVVYVYRGAWDRLPAATRKHLHELLDARPAQRWRPLAWWSITPLRYGVGPIARDGEVHAAIRAELDRAPEHVKPGRRVYMPDLYELTIERVEGGSCG